MVDVKERTELETMVISSLLQKPDDFQDMLFALDESDFQNREYKQIFINLRDGLGTADLRRGTSIRPIEFAKLITANSIPHTAYGFAEQLRELTVKESLQLELMQIQSGNFDKEQAAERITKIFEQSKFDFSDDLKSIGELMENAIHEIKENASSKNKLIYSPFKNLNSLIGGIKPGSVITIAGRPGTGKSAYALQIALAIAQRRFKTLYISLEMLGTELAMRVFSTDTGISTILMSNGDTDEKDFRAIDESARKRKADNLLITCKGKNIPEIRRQITKVKPDLLIIDSINLMQGKGESERIRITGVTREIKQMALQYKLPIIMLAQLNRETDEKVLPTLSQLKESSSIEEDSDVVILLAEIKEASDFDKINNAFYEKEGKCLLSSTDEFKVVQEEKNKLIIGIVAKNRRGAVGKVAYLCEGKRYAFEELPRISQTRSSSKTEKQVVISSTESMPWES